MNFKITRNHVLIYGAVFFTVQIIFAVLFYRERLFSDSSYYLLHTINSGWFRIDHQRFVLALSEILPLTGSYIGLPLKALLIISSLNHVFFFMALFLILVKRNDIYGALAITFILVFNTLNLFVNPMLEIWYGAGFAVLLFSFLQKDTFSKMDYLWIALLELTVLFSHPENFILVFLLGMLDVQRRKSFRRIHLMMLILFIASGAFKYFTLDVYESGKLEWNFKVTGKSDYMNLFHRGYNKKLLLFLVQYYWGLLLMLAAATCQYIVSGKYLRYAIVLFTFLGTVALINSVSDSNVFSHYCTIMYVPIVSIIIIPFCYDTLSAFNEKVKQVAFLILILPVGFRLYRQVAAVSTFTERVNQMERIISFCDETGGNKFIVNSGDFAKSYSRIGWSFPMETLLLSAERGKDLCRSIATEDDITEEKAKVILTDSNVFMLRRWDIIQDNQLNRKYFHAEKGIYKSVDYRE